MYRDIRIENFRSIRFADLKGLKRVNLIFGKNNVGKSSLLEALFLSSGQSNPMVPASINNLRDYKTKNVSDLGLYFYNFNTENKIRISSEQESMRDLTISLFESKDEKIDLDETKVSANRSFYHFGLKLDYKLNDEAYKSEIILREKEGEKEALEASVGLDDRYMDEMICTFLPSKYLYDEAIQGIHEMITDKQELILLKALRIIEPRVKDIQAVGGNFLVDIGLERRMPINMMGDGIRKLIAIIGSIYENRNGVLLIDEIDNGIHFSYMSKIWKVVMQTAEKLNTQIFATTHSIDSLKGMRDALVDSTKKIREEAASIKLIRTEDDTLEALMYDYKEFDYVIGQEIEIR